jgi:hypothetical protein
MVIGDLSLVIVGTTMLDIQPTMHFAAKTMLLTANSLVSAPE